MIEIIICAVSLFVFKVFKNVFLRIDHRTIIGVLQLIDSLIWSRTVLVRLCSLDSMRILVSVVFHLIFILKVASWNDVMIVIMSSVEMSKTQRGGKLYVVEVDRNAVKEKPKKQSYLQANKQPCKRRLQFDDSDDSNNEISQSQTLSRTRPNPTRKKNDSDSEVEKNAAVKESLLKNEFRWAFLWQSEIMTLHPTSEQWPTSISFIGKMSFQEDCSLDLEVDNEIYPSRLLCKGPKKGVATAVENYQKQLDAKVKPENLKPVYLKSERKQRFCEDINFLSKKQKTNETASSQPILSRSTHGVKATEKTVTQDERSPPKVHTPGDETGQPDDSVLPDLPKLTPAYSNPDSDAHECDEFKLLSNEHKERMELLLKAFEEECETQNRRKIKLLANLKEKRQDLKEELSYARHGFQSVDDHPEWGIVQNPVLSDGFNLMQLLATSDVAKFGRLVGDKICDQSNASFLISPKRLSENLRSGAAKEFTESFKGTGFSIYFLV